jgi:hypothetical protein
MKRNMRYRIFYSVAFLKEIKQLFHVIFSLLSNSTLISRLLLSSLVMGWKAYCTLENEAGLFKSTMTEK